MSGELERLESLGPSKQNQAKSWKVAFLSRNQVLAILWSIVGKSQFPDFSNSVFSVFRWLHFLMQCVGKRFDWAEIFFLFGHFAMHDGLRSASDQLRKFFWRKCTKTLYLRNNVHARYEVVCKRTGVCIVFVVLGNEKATKMSTNEICFAGFCVLFVFSCFEDC